MIPDWLSQENAPLSLPSLSRRDGMGSNVKGIDNAAVAGCKCKVLGGEEKLC